MTVDPMKVVVTEAGEDTGMRVSHVLGTAEALADLLHLSYTERALSDVLAERARQDATWGEQNHPLGLGAHAVPLGLAGLLGEGYDLKEVTAKFEESARSVTDTFARLGKVSFADILTEEYAELLNAGVDEVRTELVQLAAVAVQMIEAIDRGIR